jgi:hypothetical protein
MARYYGFAFLSRIKKGDPEKRDDEGREVLRAFFSKSFFGFQYGRKNRTSKEFIDFLMSEGGLSKQKSKEWIESVLSLNFGGIEIESIGFSDKVEYYKLASPV